MVQVGGGVVQHIIQVIAPRYLVDARTNGRRCREIHGRTGHRGNLTGRDKGLIGRRVVRRIDYELMIKNRARTMAPQIPIAVLGQVDHRRLVRRGFIVKAQFVVVGQGVFHHARQRAGVALFHVLADIGELHPHAVVRGEPFGRPDHLIKALHPTMEMVRLVVDGQGVFRAVEGEFPLGDPVGTASGNSSKVGAVGLVARQIGTSQGDVRQGTFPVGRLQGNEGRAIFDEHRL